MPEVRVVTDGMGKFGSLRASALLSSSVVGMSHIGVVEITTFSWAIRGSVKFTSPWCRC